MRRIIIIVLVAVVGLSLPGSAAAFNYDVGIRFSDVNFSPRSFLVGKAVRIYATVRNLGERDIVGNVFFSENGIAIGTPPPFSARGGGVAEEVWVEWQPKEVGDRQIFIRVVTDPSTYDEDLSNNEMIVPVFVDRDLDGDGIGDRDDTDDDGDGLPDDWEIAHGLNPNDPSDALRDPDGDGRSTIDEYRAGTDPFAKPPPPSSSSASGSSGSSGSVATTKPTVAPTVVVPPTPKAIARVPSPTPLVAGVKVVDEPEVLAVALPVVPLSPISAPTNKQIGDLLGGSPAPWRTALPYLAGAAVLLAAFLLLLLAIRRRTATIENDDEGDGRRSV
ncbi:MAG: hypothetical protein V1723_04610 [Candidatus Uhrbacteria bacterium]